MEVHAHTHTARKKWTHYFWEFLMLFLAVFCGFLAEYQLEHKIEKDREKQYIKSLAEDLQEDIYKLDSVSRLLNEQILGKDSIVQLIGKEIKTKGDVELFYNLHWKYVGYTTEVIFSKRTMTQLLNAGGLRLVHNKNVSGAIANYAVRIEYHEKTEQPQYVDITLKALHESKKIIDTRFMRAEPQTNSYTRASSELPVLRNANSDYLKDFSFTLEMDKENNILFVISLKEHKQVAQQLLALLEKEYHLK